MQYHSIYFSKTSCWKYANQTKCTICTKMYHPNSIETNVCTNCINKLSKLKHIDEMVLKQIKHIQKYRQVPNKINVTNTKS